VTDRGGVAFLERNLKNSRAIILKDAGHVSMMEKPEEGAKAYLRFLKERK
jgi:pimeloyl-ACP methyl ester carboxylesterase